MIENRLEISEQKILVGKSMKMTFANHNPSLLWKNFMPLKKNVMNCKDNKLYSVEVFPDSFFDNFNANNEFVKWAAVEVSSDENVSEDFQILVIPKGEYAVFKHFGPAKNASQTYSKIFMEWLPISEFEVDNRPHFAVMDEKYKQDSSESEEEIWIPIKRKS